MVITANSGPMVTFGITQSSTGIVMEYNEERGPDISDLGTGLMDPRPFYRYSPGNAVGSKILSLYDNAGFVDWVPAITSSNGLVSNGSSGVGGTTLTLTATGAGVVTASIVAPESGLTVTPVLLGSTVSGSTQAYSTFGQSGTVAAWNPQFGTGRNITIAMSSNLDGGSFTILGRDMYGFKMSETIAAGSTTLTGKKAFKYITSIQASTTLTSTGFLIGYGDVYGFPLKLPYVSINTAVAFSSNALTFTAGTVSSVTVVLASTVATQTSTTPDVRGTYASSIASNGTVRMQMIQNTDAFQMSQITASDVSPLFGATQFSSV
jgi:hypothetical protein